jgi:hypothetical protein
VDKLLEDLELEELVDELLEDLESEEELLELEDLEPEEELELEELRLLRARLAGGLPTGSPLSRGPRGAGGRGL